MSTNLKHTLPKLWLHLLFRYKIYFMEPYAEDGCFKDLNSPTPACWHIANKDLLSFQPLCLLIDCWMTAEMKLSGYKYIQYLCFIKVKNLLFLFANLVSVILPFWDFVFYLVVCKINKWINKYPTWMLPWLIPWLIPEV